MTTRLNDTPSLLQLPQFALRNRAWWWKGNEGLGGKTKSWRFVKRVHGRCLATCVNTGPQFTADTGRLSSVTSFGEFCESEPRSLRSHITHCSTICLQSCITTPLRSTLPPPTQLRKKNNYSSLPSSSRWSHHRRFTIAR